MNKILIIGAGKSSTNLIDFLINTLESKNRHLIVADISADLALKKIKNHPKAEACSIDLNDDLNRKKIIAQADLVISMLPANLHPTIAQDCLEAKKHFFTASYESDHLRSLKEEILKNNLLFLNECGLDPGLDHMSAMKIIHSEKEKGNQIVSFKSYCGGLLALESENNPWKYKFTWNPRNVVLAGQGTSRYISDGQFKFIPYHQLFKRTEQIVFENLGNFEGYPNRDSLLYRKTYQLENIPTLLRGTLRRDGFCKAWDIFVQLGMTDDSYSIELPSQYTNINFLTSFLPSVAEKDVKKVLLNSYPNVDAEVIEKIEWLGLFETTALPFKKATPAQILQHILEKKWQLEPNDKDLVVMQHQFEVYEKGKIKKITSSLICKGENQEYTAMAKTVGLPLAIIVDLFLDGKINLRGLEIPVMPEIYEPVLQELKNHGIVFEEKIETLNN
jgi:saccharopine dehydrogenase-like NADP-dependent oxidoreductase